MTHVTTVARTAALAGGLLLAAATAASAHVGQAPHVHGFGDGFVHPLLGLDHLAAMLAVGLWSATLGGAALLAVPAAFVGLLMIGAVLGAAGVPLPAVEPAITASVVVLGLLVALSVRLPLVPAALLVGAFGLVHGYAHGAEMPAAAAPLAYGLGFVAATALLHAVGIGLGLGLGRLAQRRGAVRAARLAGACVAGVGVVLALA
ncbi:HupE/UreJ family protein [Rhodoplanes sp. TEM]|uniref:HupE/UreJ family protein n=1 Tax=Rhodoplanes tepidamans TaxID=200616 RepID=A0ABT5J5Z4_RHOTP|nr:MULTISPECIES: HupE/UreJ family protein [Rhodoplanes]MDC7784460.1 HupE/UreJ family protein [Rhodoplanes tepidamans]MDC7983490.1 HupE/UreJ family protein [Rhodoplanes sp. TEM]MDQ0356967.1 urease accessory protein [Rhodoplanes tepidamans]